MCSPPTSHDGFAQPVLHLDQLLARLPFDLRPTALGGDPASTEVSGLTVDSRLVEPGSIFCCIEGGADDGHAHVDEALGRGAAVIVCEHPLAASGMPDGVVELRVPQGRARRAVAAIAVALFDAPSRELSLVGVTGTNGKTTVTHLVRSILTAHGWPAALVGTLGGARTTPEAPVLQKILAEARAAGRRAAVLEVSSHALDQHRVDGCHFAVVAFTNLSRDHLDYHGSMEAYFAAKRRLFTAEFADAAVVAVDDEWGRRLAAELAAGTSAPGIAGSTLSLTTVTRAQARDVEVTARSIALTWHGARAHVAMGGEMNVTNALVAAATGAALGIPPDAVAQGLTAAPPVPGRFEVVVPGPPVTVVVDYAHTPAALEATLTAARHVAQGNVLTVFGCGGDRDKGKRPEMGRVAAHLSDIAVITSDNSRSEDPRVVVAEVRAGASGGAADVVVELDRAAAISLAVERARPGDVVVVAGKGHETELVGPEGSAPFDDRDVVRAAARTLGWPTVEAREGRAS